MPEMKQDRLAFDLASTRTIDQDGHMHISRMNISKAAVNGYLGREIPDHDKLGLNPSQLYQLYRDPEEMEKGAATFNGKPLLTVHKPQSADDHDHELTAGSVNNVSWNPPFLQAEGVVWDGQAIAGINSNEQRELSSSYRYRADMTPGVAPDGTAFHGRMRDIVGNHVALVSKGRAGPECFVGDSAAEIQWHRIAAAFDAAFNESDHSRAANGEFTSTAGGPAASSSQNPYRYVGHTSVAAPAKVGQHHYVRDPATGRLVPPNEVQGSYQEPTKSSLQKAREANEELLKRLYGGEYEDESKKQENEHDNKSFQVPEIRKTSEVGTKTTHPFVAKFFTDHGNKGQQVLETVPKTTLNTALSLIGNDPADRDAQKLKKMIDKELDHRADRGI